MGWVMVNKIVLYAFIVVISCSFDFVCSESFPYRQLLGGGAESARNYAPVDSTTGEPLDSTISPRENALKRSSSGQPVASLQEIFLKKLPLEDEEKGHYSEQFPAAVRKEQDTVLGNRISID